MFNPTIVKVLLNSQSEAPQKNRGFTLIELLVVIIIIGALSAIAAPSWLAFINRQRVNKVNEATFTSLTRCPARCEKKQSQLQR